MHLVIKSPSCHRIQNFIIFFTKAYHFRILCHIYPVHTHISSFCNNNFNIITLLSPEVSSGLCFSIILTKAVCNSDFTMRTTPPTQPIFFHLIALLKWWILKIMKLFYFHQPTFISSLLRANIVLSFVFSKLFSSHMVLGFYHSRKIITIRINSLWEIWTQ
jgi:hypothetical protein